MAESATTSHLWEPDYDEKWKSSVIENEVLLNMLAQNMPAILKNVDLCDKFWNLLLQRGVLDEDTKRRIQDYNQKHVQAASLFHHLMGVEVYKIHGFIWALVNSNQCQLTDQLGFAVQNYLDVEVFLMSSAFQCPACHEIYTKAYVLTGCGHYLCAPCVKGAQFICKDNKKEDVTCPVPECGKITEASPSAGSIGLEEDGHFSNLCKAMLKEVTKESVETIEGKSTAGSEEEEGKSTPVNEETEGMSNTGSVEEEEMSSNCSEEENNLPQIMKEGINDLEVMISSLQLYRDILGKYEPEVKNHVVRAVENVKKNVDDWAKETLGWYSSICQQVEKNLQKSVKWKNAASELSVLVTARPGFLEGCLKGKVHLPKETVTDEGEEVITKLDSGCSIPLLFPYGGCGEETFSYTVESISKLNGTRFSPPCMIRNLPWKIKIDPHYKKDTEQQQSKSLSFSLEINEGSKCPSWSCKARCNLKLLCWKKDGEPYTRKYRHLFKCDKNYWGYFPFISWNELMDPENGYVKDDSIRLEVHIKAEPPTWHEPNSS